MMGSPLAVYYVQATWVNCCCNMLTCSKRVLCSCWNFRKLSCWFSFCFSKSWTQSKHNYSHTCTHTRTHTQTLKTYMNLLVSFGIRHLWLLLCLTQRLLLKHTKCLHWSHWTPVYQWKYVQFLIVYTRGQSEATWHRAAPHLFFI